MALTPAVKFQVLSVTCEGCAASQTRIPGAVLFDKRREATNAMRIAYVDGNGSGLAEGGDWRWHVHNGRR